MNYVQVGYLNCHLIFYRKRPLGETSNLVPTQSVKDPGIDTGGRKVAAPKENKNVPSNTTG